MMLIFRKEVSQVKVLLFEEFPFNSIEGTKN